MTMVWACEMSHAHQSILLALADHGHDDGTSIYPSFGYLAWKTGYSRRQCMRLVGELRKLGAVKRIKRGNSHKRANEYRLNLSVFKTKKPYRPTSDKVSPLDIQLVTSSPPTSDISGSTSDIAMSHQSPSESPGKHKKRARVSPTDSRSAQDKETDLKIRSAMLDLRLSSTARDPQAIAWRANVDIQLVRKYLREHP